MFLVNRQSIFRVFLLFSVLLVSMPFMVSAQEYTDGRLNKYDIGASVAVYCQPYGIDIYSIDSRGNGILAVQATTEEIEAVGASPESNTLIASGPGVIQYALQDGEFVQIETPLVYLYRLTSGELSVRHTFYTKLYTFNWEGC